MRPTALVTWNRPLGVGGRTADDGGAITYFDYDPAYAGRAFERFTYINVPGYTDRFHNLEFGVDKRRLHLGTLVASGQISRADALKGIEGIPYPSEKALEEAHKSVAEIYARHNKG